jgi:hypothetical protein
MIRGSAPPQNVSYSELPNVAPPSNKEASNGPSHGSQHVIELSICFSHLKHFAVIFISPLAAIVSPDHYIDTFPNQLSPITVKALGENAKEHDASKKQGTAAHEKSDPEITHGILNVKDCRAIPVPSGHRAR